MTATLAACMIVRDEIDCLERCLDSLMPWVDQIVIVDTGSVDGTWELVKLRAHRYRQVVWTDHFADARNHALDLVEADWVLVVDADEHLRSGGSELRTAIEDPNLLAAEICLENQLDGGDVGRFWAARLFRSRPDIRYTGRIHEQVAGAIRDCVAAEARWQTRRLSTVLQHDGYLEQNFEKKGKAERNIRLLERSMAELPADAPVHQRVYLEYKLAAALGAGPQGTLWLLRAGARLIQAPQAVRDRVPLAAEILVSASQTWCRTGEGRTALEAAECAARCSPGHPMVGLVTAQALLLLGETDRASTVLAGLSSAHTGGFYFDAEGHAVALAVARAEVAHREEQHGMAVDILSAASSELPDNQILCLAQFHSLVRASRAQEALRGAVAFLKSHPGSRGGLLACSEAAHALGMTEKAQRWHRMATG
jgi:hypothetical protein